MTALLRLLEAGASVLEGQPDHPLARELAAAMEEAVHALGLASAQRVQP